MSDSLLSIIDALQDRKVMIIGDMVADVYLEGKIVRISREAPVLILEHAGETVVPGGAANAVHNAATLGGRVYAVGVVGNDSAGSELARILSEKGVVTDGLIVDASRPTITKTRVMAGGQATVRQQVVRIDREAKTPLNSAIEAAVLDYIDKHLPAMDAVVMSDYGSGTVTAAVIAQVVAGCRRANIPCIVDSRYNIMAFTGVTVVKQNETEAAAAVGLKALDDHTLIAAGEKIRDHLAAQAVLITRGPDGMTLFDAQGQITNIPVTNKSEVYDVTGAGDTVVAAMTLALAAGASYLDAARLANFAAGIVVRKPGTATTTPEELREAVASYYENRQ